MSLRGALVARFFVGVGAIGMLAIMFATSVDIALRQTGLGGVPASIELSEVLLGVVAMAGVVVGLQDRAHVASSIVTDRLRPALRFGVIVGGMLVAGTFLAWTAVETSLVAIESAKAQEYRYGIVKFPIWPGRVFCAVALLTAVAIYVRPLFWVGSQSGKQAVLETTHDPEDIHG